MALMAASIANERVFLKAALLLSMLTLRAVDAVHSVTSSDDGQQELQNSNPEGVVIEQFALQLAVNNEMQEHLQEAERDAMKKLKKAIQAEEEAALKIKQATSAKAKPGSTVAASNILEPVSNLIAQLTHVKPSPDAAPGGKATPASFQIGAEVKRSPSSFRKAIDDHATKKEKTVTLAATTTSKSAATTTAATTSTAPKKPAALSGDNGDAKAVAKKSATTTAAATTGASGTTTTKGASTAKAA
eukprot:TRINITY_DN6506_c0_g1_i2.p1 TRINITY_DN6506_c0_g1~~TRINITY_DN6506_c0_g1_i2.p1  ORF type:complete len:245 (+),score=65.57 TRINITY_DN6506_c0_g1_i2:63-797(+)